MGKHVYVAFDGDNDIHYYRLMCAWHVNPHHEFTFYDAHDLQQSRDSSQEETIKRSLHERLKKAGCFVVLIGDHSRYLYRFLRWEMEQALTLNLPIVGVNLNGRRSRDDERCPPIIYDELVLYVGFHQAIIQKAIDDWPQSSVRHKANGKTGPFHYPDSVYSSLGIR